MESKMTTSLEAYTKMKEAGFPEPQALAIAESIQTHSEITLKDLPTKTDFAKLGNKVDKLESRMDNLQGKVDKLEKNALRIENDIHWLTRLFMGSTLFILLGLALNFLHH